MSDKIHVVHNSHMQTCMDSDQMYTCVYMYITCVCVGKLVETFLFDSNGVTCSCCTCCTIALMVNR